MSRRRTMGVLALLTVALSGCTGDPAPTPAPEPTAPAGTTSSEPTSPTASPTPTSSPEPVALSPEETVRAWVKALNAMFADGDPATFAELSTPGCEECNQLSTSVSEAYAAGGQTRTKGWTVVSVMRQPTFERSRRVAAAIDAARSVTTLKRGGKEIVTAPDKFIIEVRVEKVGARWLVGELDFLS